MKEKILPYAWYPNQTECLRFRFFLFFVSLGSESTLGCPGSLKTGDIYTHTYHGYASTIIDTKTRDVCSDVIEARSRGVLFDVGHGAGAFSWVVGELAVKNNFFPDMLGKILVSSPPTLSTFYITSHLNSLKIFKYFIDLSDLLQRF